MFFSKKFGSILLGNKFKIILQSIHVAQLETSTWRLEEVNKYTTFLLKTTFFENTINYYTTVIQKIKDLTNFIYDDSQEGNSSSNTHLQEVVAWLE